MKINKKHFIPFIAVVVMTIALAVAITYANDTPNIIDYNTYVVMSGDTLWDIAESINDGTMNTGEIMYDIKKASNLDTSSLRLGDRLQIPIYEED